MENLLIRLHSLSSVAFRRLATVVTRPAVRTRGEVMVREDYGLIIAAGAHAGQQLDTRTEDSMTCVKHQSWRLPTLAVAVAIVTLAAPTRASADPIGITGTVFVHSAGGDFPDIPQPISELIYTLQGPGLPAARGEVLETSPIHGTGGGLVVTTSPVPVPLAAGQPFDLTTRATFTRGQAIEAESGRVYNIAGDFLFSSATAILHAGDFGLLVARAPFSLDGVLTGSNQATGAILFQQQLRGVGVGRVHLFEQNPQFFSFQFDVQPIPEPATLVLIGTGIGGVLALKRKRR